MRKSCYARDKRIRNKIFMSIPTKSMCCQTSRGGFVKVLGFWVNPKTVFTGVMINLRLGIKIWLMVESACNNWGY